MVNHQVFQLYCLAPADYVCALAAESRPDDHLIRRRVIVERNRHPVSSG